MRIALTIGLALGFCGSVVAQKKDPADTRFGIEIDKDGFPQGTPKDALRSVLKAAEAGRFDYLVAHLAEPAYVDQQIKDVGSFEKLVDIVRKRWTNDPENSKELRRFLADGEWEETADTATAKLKDLKSRQVTLKKVGARWYLENRAKPQAKS